MPSSYFRQTNPILKEIGKSKKNGKTKIRWVHKEREIGKSERIRKTKNRKLESNQEEDHMGVNHKNTCLPFVNLLYLIMQRSCRGKRFVT